MCPLGPMWHFWLFDYDLWLKWQQAPAAFAIAIARACDYLKYIDELLEKQNLTLDLLLNWCKFHAKQSMAQRHAARRGKKSKFLDMNPESVFHLHVPW